jgi:hypothetical protein
MRGEGGVGSVVGEAWGVLHSYCCVGRRPSFGWAAEGIVIRALSLWALSELLFGWLGSRTDHKDYSWSTKHAVFTKRCFAKEMYSSRIGPISSR